MKAVFKIYCNESVHKPNQSVGLHIFPNHIHFVKEDKKVHHDFDRTRIQQNKSILKVSIASIWTSKSRQIPVNLRWHNIIY